MAKKEEIPSTMTAELHRLGVVVVDDVEDTNPVRDYYVAWRPSFDGEQPPF